VNRVPDSTGSLHLAKQFLLTLDAILERDSSRGGASVFSEQEQEDLHQGSTKTHIHTRLQKVEATIDLVILARRLVLNCDQ
jgi:hypothetical protein